MDTTFKEWAPQFEWILNIIDAGVHLVDKQGITVFYNEMMANIDGLSQDQVLGKNVFQLFPSLTEETSTIKLVLSKGEKIVDKVQNYVNVKGKKISSINSTYPLYQGDEIVGAVEIAKDITKIMNMYDQLLDLRKQLTESKLKMGKSSGTADYHFGDLIGNDPTFIKAISFAKKASRSSSPVLISGPTGTGKELVAQSIHNASIRRGKPFIAQNCAAVPKELMEGLLFGTTKGAFTGSIDRQGIFEQAHGGTLFLDELNSLDLVLQAKLLRVIQEGKIRRLGAMEENDVDIRIIAAMNISSNEAMEKGILRKDLYYRLNVVHINLPPLRERKEDIPLLVSHFIEVFNGRFGTTVHGIKPNALERLKAYHWPGNVRELSHTIESAFNLMEMDHDLIEEHHLPPHTFPILTANLQELRRFQVNHEKMDLPNLLDTFERKVILEVFSENQGNISRTAEALGVKRQALQYKLTKYGIQRNN